MEDIYKNTKNVKERIVGFDLAELLLGSLGFRPSGDYTIDDLILLENMIDREFPNEKETPTSVFFPVGWYYGKTIIKNIKGSYWEGDGQDVLGLGVKFKSENGEVCIFPFVRAKKFLKNREDGMVCFFEMTSFLINGGAEKMQDIEYLKKVADKDGWVNFPEDNKSKGFKIRLTAILAMQK